MNSIVWPDTFDPAKQRAFLDANGKAVFVDIPDDVRNIALMEPADGGDPFAPRIERAKELAAKAVEQRVGSNGLLDQIVEAGTSRQTAKGQLLLESILNMDEKLRADRDRNVNIVCELLDGQPGADLTAGSAAHVYNGLTYWADHLRGRSESTRIDSSMLGDSRLLEQKSWDLCLDLCAALEARA